MNDNPWHRLPKSPPFVLPDDKSAVEDFNDRPRIRAVMNAYGLEPLHYRMSRSRSTTRRCSGDSKSEAIGLGLPLRALCSRMDSAQGERRAARLPEVQKPLLEPACRSLQGRAFIIRRHASPVASWSRAA